MRIPFCGKKTHPERPTVGRGRSSSEPSIRHRGSILSPCSSFAQMCTTVRTRSSPNETKVYTTARPPFLEIGRICHRSPRATSNSTRVAWHGGHFNDPTLSILIAATAAVFQTGDDRWMHGQRSLACRKREEARRRDQEGRSPSLPLPDFLSHASPTAGRGEGLR